MTSLTIGLPVYNGSDLVERALRSLLEQTYRDFIIVVSDNASTDETVDIVQRIALEDSRIRLIRQTRNVGVTANFMSLARSAGTPYFMWAAADDRWSANYIEASVDLLSRRADVGFASGAVINVDRAGTHLRRMRDFDLFGVGSSTSRLLRYAWMLEASGKANIIYSVFRTQLLQELCAEGAHAFDEWGGDMAMIAAALSRTSYAQDKSATLFKQVDSKSDIQTSCDAEAGRFSRLEFGGAFPPALRQQFTRSMTVGLKDQRQKIAVTALLWARRFLTYRWEGGQKLRNLRRRLFPAQGH